MKQLNRTCITSQERPVRILQFGGGNFLRAFFGWIIQVLNQETNYNGAIAVVKPTPVGSYQLLREQEGLYQVLLHGIRDGREATDLKLVDAITRVVNPYQEWEVFLQLAEIKELKLVVSNTTEAGINFDPLADRARVPENFPAKLALWLNHRYRYFQGSAEAGCIILPCELIADNGAKLKFAVLEYAREWQLGDEFSTWITVHNLFCNTLVDRIVSGYPEDLAQQVAGTTGWEDKLLVAGELYHSWVIEGPSSLMDYLPFDETSLNVRIVQDLAPFHELKVRVLNGTHTLMVPVGILLGFRYVRECVEDPEMRNFLEGIQDEIGSILQLPREEVLEYRKQVMARFANPYIRHNLMSIALNAIPKFRSRVLPSIISFKHVRNKLPPGILFAFAALIYFYKGDIEIPDAPETVLFFKETWAGYQNTPGNAVNLVRKVLGNELLWGSKLNEIEGLADTVGKYLHEIADKGMAHAVSEVAQH